MKASSSSRITSSITVRTARMPPGLADADEMLAARAVVGKMAPLWKGVSAMWYACAWIQAEFPP